MIRRISIRGSTKNVKQAHRLFDAFVDDQTDEIIYIEIKRNGVVETISWKEVEAQLAKKG